MTNLNIYTLNNTTWKYKKQIPTEIKRETENLTTIVSQ